jgi:hypothetical protein
VSLSAAVTVQCTWCRCLAFAIKSLEGTVFAGYDGSTEHEAHKALQDVSQYGKIESGLTLVGLAGLQVRHAYQRHPKFAEYDILVNEFLRNAQRAPEGAFKSGG